MISWGKLESLMMIVCWSFWRWGRSLSEHSGVLRTLAVLQFQRTGELFSLLRVVFPTIQPVLFIGTTCRMFGSRTFGGHFKPKVWSWLWTTSWAACGGCRDEKGSGPPTPERALSRLSMAISTACLVPLSALLNPSPSSTHCPQAARSISDMQVQFSIFRGFILHLEWALESWVGPARLVWQPRSPPRHHSFFLLLRLSTCCSLYLSCSSSLPLCLRNSHSVFRCLLKCHFSREDFSSASRSFSLIKSIAIWNVSVSNWVSL